MNTNTKEIDYFDILKKAFFMTWHNKFMWFFGFFVCIGSTAAAFNNPEAIQPSQLLQWIQLFNQKYPLLSASLTFLFILAIAALYLLKIVSTAALIKISNNITVYRQAKIKTIFAESKEYVWRMLAMEILIGAVTFFIATAIILPIAYLYSLNSQFLAFTFLIFGFIIISILIILAFYLVKYGQIFLVLSDSKIKNALESAYELLEKNLKQSALFGLISIGLNFLFILLLILIIFALVLLFSLIGFLLYLFFAKSGALISLLTMGFVLIILILGLFSWFNAFMQSAWVLFFQHLSLEKKEDDKEKETEIETSSIIPDPEAV
ncbi:MAG: hypothetical protein ACD_56C00169G0002 [uncultured bacterium]|nr:MAG: hypothetical protein ACD_56C00169G0002 [uncultured bacterium]